MTGRFHIKTIKCSHILWENNLLNIWVGFSTQKNSLVETLESAANSTEIRIGVTPPVVFFPLSPCILTQVSLWNLDWDREKLLEAWMSNAENCCQRSGVQMPTPPPRGYNTWDTLPSPRTPRTTRSSITSPDEISLTPADDDCSLVRDQIWSSISECTASSVQSDIQ